MNTYFKRVVVGSFCIMQLFANIQAIVVNFEGEEPEYFANTKTWHEVSDTIRHQMNENGGLFHFSIKFAKEELRAINDRASEWWDRPISECLESSLLSAYRSSDLTINAFISRHNIGAFRDVMPNSSQPIHTQVKLAQEATVRPVTVTKDVTVEGVEELNKYIKAFESLRTRYKKDSAQFIEDMMFSDNFVPAIDENLNVLDSMNSKLYQKFYDSLSAEQRDDFKRMFFYGTRHPYDDPEGYLYENLQKLTNFFSVKR